MRITAIFLLWNLIVQTVPGVFAQELSLSGSALPVNHEVENSPFLEEAEIDSVVISAVESVYSPLSVRINEVMWMGSDLSTADEWIELTAVPLLSGSVVTEPLSLEGWTVNSVKDGVEAVIARFDRHIIHSGGYLTVANYTAGQSRLRFEPSLVTSGLSLPNTKLHVRLRDDAGNLKDEVDDGVGAPFSGLNPSAGTKASMERLDGRVSGTLQSNWRSASTKRGWDSEAHILGTPGFPNGSVEPPDTAAPLDATDLRAFAWSGSVLIAWNPSTSPDVSSQEIGIYGDNSSELIHLSFRTDVRTALIPQLSAQSVHHHSVDESGHYSTGVLIHVQPLHKPIIDEILSDPVGSDSLEWIELSNPFEVSLDLRGWTLHRGSKNFMLQGTGAILYPGEYRVFTTQMTGLTLPNSGGEVRLSFLGQTIDRLSYGALPEGISVGRLHDSSPVPLCTPHPLGANRSLAPHVTIDGLDVTGTSTFNLEARALSGSLTAAQCLWDYGDGYSYAGCNPPSHAMKLSGHVTISLTVKDYCGTTVLHSHTVFINSKPKSVSTNTQISQCKHVVSNALRITELLPAPLPGQQEWIEIQNTGTGSVSLCGWSVDDAEAGSKPYKLGSQQVEAGGNLLVSSSDSGIALNNDQDHVRLIGPVAGGGTGVLMMVPYQNAQTGKSYAVREDGEWVWSSYLTPGALNTFEDITIDQSSPTVVLHAALPNPTGTDTYHEWIELKNLTARPQWLNGWMIESASGKTLDLTGTVLSKNELKHIQMPDRFTLGNTKDSLKLRDDEGRIRSVLAWRTVKNGEVIRRYEGFESLTPTRVTVLDGLKLQSTFVFDGEQKTIHLSAGLAGIKEPKNYEKNINKNTLSALIKNKKIELKSDSQASIFYAYADGVEVAPLLLQMGQAYVRADQMFERRNEYLLYEEEARKNKRGIWSTDLARDQLDQEIQAEGMDARVKREGIILSVTPPSGLISSGEVLQVKSSVPVQLYRAIGTGSFEVFSGSQIMNNDAYIRVRAEYELQSGTGGTISSTVATREYILLKDRYKPCIAVSEVYPSPLTGEVEWVELENICSEDISLLGWRIDDEAAGGSKVQKFGTGIVLSGHAIKVLSGGSLKIVLNNGGDGVSVYMPNGRVSDSVWYPSLKKGRAYARLGSRYCITDKPTPGAGNECILTTPVKKAKTAASKKPVIGLKTAFSFISVFAGELNTKVDLGFTLYEGLNSKNDKNNYLKISLAIFVLLLIGFSVFFLSHKKGQ